MNSGVTKFQLFGPFLKFQIIHNFPNIYFVNIKGLNKPLQMYVLKQSDVHSKDK